MVIKQYLKTGFLYYFSIKILNFVVNVQSKNLISMKEIFHLLIILLFFFLASCTSNANKQTSSQDESTTSAPLKDQSEGIKILQKLTRIYGSFSIGDLRTPSFIEGRYFDDENYIVFQARGDSSAIRDSIKKIAGSNLFRLEMINEGRYSQKELKEILYNMHKKLSNVNDEILKENIIGSGMGAHNIYVTFIRDTPEMRKAFREKVSDSPAIKFGSSVRADENNSVYPSDTLSISLKPEYSVYADTASSVSIILLNNTNDIIGCGEHYSVTYQNENGTWRNLPINGMAFDVLHFILGKSYFRTNAFLYPKINNNKPGKYRFFYDINLSPKSREANKIKMMTEFTLTNDYEAVKNAKRIELPNKIIYP